MTSKFYLTCTFTASFIISLASITNVACFVLVHSSPRRVVKELHVSNGDGWGHFAEPQFCSPGSYAVGYEMKIEGYQGGGLSGGDDTALNAIKLRCELLHGGTWTGDVTSAIGPWGDWREMTRCDNDITHGDHDFLKSFALQVEPYRGNKDDTAANFIKFHCGDFAGNKAEYEIATSSGHGMFGSFGDYSPSCDDNTAICGLSTRIESRQGGHDDTSLNDVILYCCEE